MVVIVNVNIPCMQTIDEVGIPYQTNIVGEMEVPDGLSQEEITSHVVHQVVNTISLEWEPTTPQKENKDADPRS